MGTLEKVMEAVGVEITKEERMTSRAGGDAYDTSAMLHLVSKYIKELLNIRKMRLNSPIGGGQRIK